MENTSIFLFRILVFCDRFQVCRLGEKGPNAYKFDVFNLSKPSLF